MGEGGVEAIVDILKAVVEGRGHVPLHMKCKSRAKGFLILILRLLPLILINFNIPDATALRGLMATALIIVENVTCLGNETSTSQCNATVPAMTPRCFTSFPGAAAGVCCAQGIL